MVDHNLLQQTPAWIDPRKKKIICAFGDIYIQVSYSVNCNEETTTNINSSSDKEAGAPDSDARTITYYLVSSSVLRLASPVWKVLLDPESPFKEGQILANSNTKEDRVVEFAENENNPEVLGILFSVFHLGFKDVPKEVTFEQLRDLAVLCDRYQCADALLAFKTVHTWLDQWRSKIKIPGYGAWIFIARVFDEYRIYLECVRTLMLHGVYHRNCNDSKKKLELIWLSGERSYLDMDYVPSKVSDFFWDIRNRYISMVFLAIYRPMNLYVHVDDPRDHFPQHLCARKDSESRLSCGTYQYGKLNIILRSLNLPRDASPVGDSLTNHWMQTSSIQGIHDRLTSCFKDSTNNHHSGCYTALEGIREAVIEVFDESKRTIFESYIG